MKVYESTVAASTPGWAPPQPMSRCFLEISSPQRTRWHELTQDTVILGSSPDADVSLTDPGVLPQHAVLRRDPHGYTLMGLGPVPGILLEGALSHGGRLPPKRRVRIGDTWLSLHVGSSPLDGQHDPRADSDMHTAMHISEDDPDDDEDADAIDDALNAPPSFSLIRRLIETRGLKSPQAQPRWELIRFCKEHIFAIQPLSQGRTVVVNRDFSVRVDRSGHCYVLGPHGLSMSEDPKLEVFQDLSRTLIGLSWVRLPQDWLAIKAPRGDHYLLRRVYTSPLQLKLEPRANLTFRAMLGTSSLWLHMVILVMMSVFSGAKTPPVAPVSKPEDTFATLDIQTLLMPSPTPTPTKPVEISRPSVTTPSPRRSKILPKRDLAQASKRPMKQAVADIRHMGALGKLAGSGLFGASKRNTHQLVAAASNVSAVRSDVGGFSVSGNIAALPGNEVRLARIAPITERSGTLKGDGFGSVTVGKRQAQSIRGLVVDASPPPSDVSIRGGLTREEIAAVVQKHLSQIRYCYEKGLMEDAALSGKIGMKWQIAPSGSVSQASIASSTVQNSAVHHCLASEIESWMFPKPRNQGVVLVNFPFVFNSTSF